ncbi:hypothetical protein B0H16DRAFT_1453938 [Mycena metata]|uniref:Uncharacterized protein n=1 Tax=Mycena metata TaxID=1033252 RepID=A0AAD7NLX4_9AGAR|nr:hypothetical protein B0H16DRAFT_1453938 [Mycena metata]
MSEMPEDLKVQLITEGLVNCRIKCSFVTYTSGNVVSRAWVAGRMRKGHHNTLDLRLWVKTKNSELSFELKGPFTALIGCNLSELRTPSDSYDATRPDVRTHGLTVRGEGASVWRSGLTSRGVFVELLKTAGVVRRRQHLATRPLNAVIPGKRESCRSGYTHIRYLREHGRRAYAEASAVYVAAFARALAALPDAFGPREYGLPCLALCNVTVLRRREAVIGVVDLSAASKEKLRQVRNRIETQAHQRIEQDADLSGSIPRNNRSLKVKETPGSKKELMRQIAITIFCCLVSEGGSYWRVMQP